MFKKINLYRKSAKHWKKQIEKGEEEHYLPIHLCDFCIDCNTYCKSCKINKKICSHPSTNSDCLVGKIANKKNHGLFETSIKLAKQLHKKLRRKALYLDII